jgi:hypothetical protein
MSPKPHSWIPIRFIDDEIQPIFEEPPMLSKKPDPPAGFQWGDRTFTVAQLISSWFDFERKGRAARNMRIGNLRSARKRGSWGVGRFYFRVLTESGRAFDLYFDRAPKDAGDRKGHWILWRELDKGK